MMIKKLLMGFGLCSVLAFPATNALANCSAEVIQAGSANAGKVVKLKNISLANCGTWAMQQERYFLLDNTTAGNANGMLAAALSAQASGNTVFVIPKAGGSAYIEWSSLQAVYSQTTP